MEERLVLLDSNSLANRAFYALPPMITKDGLFTNAVYGYLNMLIKIISEIKPTHIVATFDVHAPTFRKSMYDEYKAQRKPMPDELRMQMPCIKELLAAMNIAIVEKEGYEADDVIGTLSKDAKNTYIITGDRDSLQLVSDNTTVWLTKKGITEVVEYTPERLKEDGLVPSGIIDLKALMGDKSDNIPGVPGVGEKTAMGLIAEYGDLDGVYKNLDKIKGKLQEKLRDNEELARLSYKLATIDTNVPLDVNIDECRLIDPFNQNSRKVMERLNFKSVLQRLEFTDEGGENVSSDDLDGKDCESVEVDNIAELKKTLSVNGGEIAVYVGNTIEFAFDGKRNYRVKLAEGFLDDGINYGEALLEIAKVLGNRSVKKYVYDVKGLMQTMNRESRPVAVENADDILIKAYLVDSNINYRDIYELLSAYSISDKEIASSMFRLDKEISLQMSESLYELYKNIELPLAYLLYDMEISGFAVDRDMLESLREDFRRRVTELSDAIKSIAGKDFNVNSPKQLGEVLFVDLGLKGGKKTKSGYSTNIETLSGLVDKHPIVPIILKYRDVQKILSTYLDGMEGAISKDGRIRTSFRQTVTATGRLSSTEPNLQNLPVRKPEGRIIRKMFVSSEGRKLVCADYSQIELRLMAHFSGDETLIKAFNDGVDIHTLTASKVYGVDPSIVSKDMRRSAKAVNFGIIYGISDFGLASDLGISTREAKAFIEKYFETYPKVKEYMDNIVAVAKEQGYVETICHRVRKIPELKASNYNTRSFGERVAMNTPLQGSASDIIKLAMLSVDKALKDGGYKAKLIMQVHDELIIDTPTEEVAAVEKMLKDAMENVVSLKVKLVADVSHGDNWLEAKE